VTPPLQDLAAAVRRLEAQVAKLEQELERRLDLPAALARLDARDEALARIERQLDVLLDQHGAPSRLQ
jgi:C4-dicarboxylate-specific signal transduction histidine kinase